MGNLASRSYHMTAEFKLALCIDNVLFWIMALGVLCNMLSGCIVGNVDPDGQYWITGVQHLFTHVFLWTEVQLCSPDTVSYDSEPACTISAHTAQEGSNQAHWTQLWSCTRGSAPLIKSSVLCLVHRAGGTVQTASPTEECDISPFTSKIMRT